MRLDLTLLELIPLVPALPLLAALWIAIGYIFGGNRGDQPYRAHRLRPVATDYSCYRSSLT